MLTLAFDYNINKRFIQDLEKEVNKLAKNTLLVGIPENDEGNADSKRPTNAMIGYINEKGSPAMNIPARPFLEPSLYEAKDEIANIMRPTFQDVHIKQKKGTLDEAGMLAVSKVKNWIREQKGFAPISPKTFEARQRRRKNGQAGDKALIDTANFINSITYVVANEDYEVSDILGDSN